ncbi:MAG TPA: beta-ketoacyl-[acyl-carrier-protein] synthase family protein [Polyangiaceae bacterium]
MAVRPRIAVTGVGLVSALGIGRREVFRRVCAGERGLRDVTLFDTAGLRSRIAGEVRDFDVRDALGSSWSQDASRCDGLAMRAAREALECADARDHANLGIVLGGTTGGMYETELGLRDLPTGSLPVEHVRRLLDFPLSVSVERLARTLGAERVATIASACASSAFALILGASWLLSGRAARVLAGGVDGLCQLTFTGFNALGAADPAPCRPFDVTRAGLNLGEGSAFLVLELEAEAKRRGARVLGWLSGWAMGSEAHHVTHPDPAGHRAAELIEEALRCAGLAARDIDYVNAHGTGTQQNDAMEARALERALGRECERIWVSSCKAQLGHTLGAAGAIEAALTVLALEAGVVLPAVGLEAPEARSLRHALGPAKQTKLRAALSNSFGFGGSCAVLAFESPDAAARQCAAPGRPNPVISAAVVVGPERLVSVNALAREPAPEAGAPAKQLALDPLSALNPDRSRRFGRASALACVGIEALLQGDHAPRGSCGLVLSSAYGDVERSVRFIRRVFAGGPRLASPAEFPQLLASSASGNASLYMGLRGPCLTVSEGDAGGEAALSVALSVLALARDRACLAGGVEAFDSIVDELLAPSSQLPRSEGGGFVLLEDEASALGAGRLPLARIVEHVARHGAWVAQLRAVSAPARAERAAVFCSSQERAALDELAQSSWADVTRVDLTRALGYHEAFGAIALAVAAARIAQREIDEALLIRLCGDSFYLTRLAAVDSRAAPGVPA